MPQPKSDKLDKRPASHTPEASEADEANLFYERLEQAGQLADISSDAELANLPSRITHVRRADGSVQRIGFS